MRFLITNKTKFQLRHLRAFVVRGYQVAAACAGPERTAQHARYVSRLRITIAPYGVGHASGQAYVGSGHAHVSLGTHVNKRDAAYVIAHELGHCIGLKHPDMTGGPLSRPDEEQSRRVFGWADKLPLETIPVPAKPNGDQKRAAELANAKASIIRWQSKAKRAANALKKLESRVKVLEKISKESLDIYI